MMFYIFLSFLIIVLLLVAIFTLIFVVFCFNMLFVNLWTGVPWAKVPAANLEKILAEVNLPSGALVYDLGCGDGRFLFLAEKKGFKAIGYELAYYPYLKSVWFKFLKGSQVKIINKDFLKQDLKEASAIFIFLTASVMEKIATKLKENLKVKTIVISYGFTLPGWNIIKTLETKPSKTYIYKQAN